MSNLTQGTIIYDSYQKRMDIDFGIENYYGGLSCGECFEVKIDNKWVAVRMEYNGDWFLVGLKKQNSIIGLQARI